MSYIAQGIQAIFNNKQKEYNLQKYKITMLYT